MSHINHTFNQDFILKHFAPKMFNILVMNIIIDIISKHNY